MMHAITAGLNHQANDTEIVMHSLAIWHLLQSTDSKTGRYHQQRGSKQQRSAELTQSIAITIQPTTTKQQNGNDRAKCQK